MIGCLKPYYVKSGEDRRLVPCGYCAVCLKKERAEWSFRMAIENRYNLHSQFLTLTYSNEYLPISENSGYMTLYKPDFQNFMKRLKERAKPINLRFFMVGEYGGETYRPHYHVALWGLPNRMLPLVEKSWSMDRGKTKMGDIGYGNLEPASISYMTSYILNKKKPGKIDGYVPKYQKAYRDMSKGIGKVYVDKNSDFHAKNEIHYVTWEKWKLRIPRYYRDKIFNEEQKEKEREKVSDYIIEAITEDFNDAITRGNKYSKVLSERIRQSDQKLKKQIKIGIL